MVLDTVKIYLDGTMIRFESDNPEFNTRSTPTGRVEFQNQGNGFVFTDVIHETIICSVKNFDDVLDATGTAYGASQEDVLTALNAFANFKQGGGGAFPYRSGLYTNFQETSSGVSQVAFAANRLVGYYINVKDTVGLESVRISQSGGTLGAGEFVIGIYEIDENLNPTNLVGQSDPLSPFITSVSGPQEVQLQSNITLNNGFYAMAYLSNYAGFSVRGGISAQTFFGSDINISNPFSIGVFSLPVTYSATMPATGSPVVEGSSLFLTQSTPFFGFKIV